MNKQHIMYTQTHGTDPFDNTAHIVTSLKTVRLEEKQPELERRHSYVPTVHCPRVCVHRGMVNSWMEAFREATGIKIRPSSASSTRRSTASLLSSRSGSTFSPISFSGTATRMSTRQLTTPVATDSAGTSLASTAFPTPSVSRTDAHIGSGRARRHSFPGFAPHVDARRVYKHWREEEEEVEEARDEQFGGSAVEVVGVRRGDGRPFRNCCPVYLSAFFPHMYMRLSALLFTSEAVTHLNVQQDLPENGKVEYS